MAMKRGHVREGALLGKPEHLAVLVAERPSHQVVPAAEKAEHLFGHLHTFGHVQNARLDHVLLVQIQKRHFLALLLFHECDTSHQLRKGDLPDALHAP
jgi:hypothetical protein